MITIQMLQASYGDTLLVHIVPENNGEKEVNLLIDCGMNYIKGIFPIIEEMGSELKTIDRFIITHYDRDHIENAQKLLKSNGDHKNPNVVKIDQIWYNSYCHLQFDKKATKVISEKELQKVKDYIAVGTPENDETEIGALQGIELAGEIYLQNYPWNEDANKKAICVEYCPEIKIREDVTIKVISPTVEKLRKLESEFIEELEGKGITVLDNELMDDAFEVFLHNFDKYEKLVEEGEIGYDEEKEINITLLEECYKNPVFDADEASANGSSIAFILENRDKKVLFLADAQCDVIIPELKRLYPDENKYPIIFDAIKVSHHGSQKNADPELFKIIDSPKFLISTNGKHPKHNHPDIQTIALIVVRTLPEGITNRELIFNYDIGHLKGLEDERLKERFNYTSSIKQKIKV